MDFTKVKSAAIIGAGVAGLATARTLRSEGIDCTVFERNATIGGVWSDGYLSYGVQVPKELYEFPEYPIPDDVPSFTPGPIFQRYLEDYTDHFAIRPLIQFNTVVESVEQLDAEAPRWRVTYTEDNKSQHQDFDLVVVCIGLFSNTPHMPTFADQEQFRGSIIHISEMKSGAQLEGKKVAIVGFGKSATDAALEAEHRAEETHLIARQLHWPIPRKLAGILPFKWGLLNRLSITLVPPYKNPTSLERAVHGLGKPLVWLYWRLVEILLYFQLGLGSQRGTRPSLVPKERIEIDAFNEAIMVVRPDFYRLVRNGRINLQLGEIAQYVPDGLQLADGQEIEADIVVFGTGWRSDYGFLSEELQRRLGFADDGIYLYRQILHPEAPGLVFIGHASTVSNILTYCMQARWVVALISGQHQLPGRDAMLQEIDALKTWKRSWMPFSSARSARLIVHMQHYLDELLQDFGANHLRKRGIWAPLMEVIAPCQPNDYRAISFGGRRAAGQYRQDDASSESTDTTDQAA